VTTPATLADLAEGLERLRGILKIIYPNHQYSVGTGHYYSEAFDKFPCVLLYNKGRKKNILPKETMRMILYKQTFQMNAALFRCGLTPIQPRCTAI